MARTPTAGAAGVRLFVIGTPRSGNTWLSHLLAAAHGVPRTSSHDLSAAVAAALPAAFVHQVHLPATDAVRAAVREIGAAVTTIARHPLDVLLSVLQFAVHNHETARWLARTGGDERRLWAATPTSRAFLDYATGPRAAALLAVTPTWWDVEGVARVRYEELVADAPRAIRAVLPPDGGAAANVDRAVEACTIPELKQTVGGPHFWHGRPGLWERLLPSAVAGAVAAAHADVFARLGYPVPAAVGPTAAVAEQNWVELLGAQMPTRLGRVADSVAAEFDRLEGV